MPEGGVLKPDLPARLRALRVSDRTFLIEAGAGCGTTSRADRSTG
jgi:hypothetical protein